jgi:acetylornithine/N-succinyldiaminopimelate aminotransferase
VAPYLEKKLLEVMNRHSCIKEHRGIGLMQGLLFEQPVGPIINRALEKGLLLINAGPNIIRFVPALVITEKDVDQMIEILEECIEE